MLLIIKRLKQEVLIVRKDNNIDTIKDTIKLIQLLITALDGDKILFSSGIGNRVLIICLPDSIICLLDLFVHIDF
jgi:hypothetical protein